jgi:hypothetical protein
VRLSVCLRQSDEGFNDLCPKPSNEGAAPAVGSPGATQPNLDNPSNGNQENPSTINSTTGEPLGGVQ